MEILRGAVGFVHRSLVESQEVEERLRDQFLSDQALSQALGLEELLREILRGKVNSFVWFTPIFTPIQTQFRGFVRSNITMLADPYVIPSLPNYKPVQAFEEVRIEPDGADGIVEIYAGKVDILEYQHWIDGNVLVSRFTEACKHPSQRLVRYGDFIADRDAYNPHFEAEEYLSASKRLTIPL